MGIFRSALAAGSLLALSAAQQGVNSTFSPARPPAIPLAVRSPYLSVWQAAGSLGGNGGYLAGEWPVFWPGQILGWAGLIRVDGLAYTWMGAPVDNTDTTPPVVNQTAFSYTSTRSVFTMDVGGFVNMTITFLSNITPDDFKRQSLPLSYMNVEVSSADGQSHALELYSDISAEWVSGDRGAIAQWEYGVTGGSSVSSAASVTATASAAGRVRRDAEAEVPAKREILEERQNDGSHKTYGTRTDAPGATGTVLHSDFYALPKTSGYIDPHPTTSQARTATPSSTSGPKPSPSSVGGIAYHKIYRQTQLLWSEVAQQTEYGNWYWLTNNSASLTHQSGTDEDVRSQFITTGYLTNTEDTNYRAINDDYPVFGFAFGLGNVTTAVSQTWGISLNQQSCVQFEAPGGNQSVPCLWTDYFSDDLDAISFYYNDYSTVTDLATTFDNKVASDSDAAAGSNYTLITSLGARQAFGALEWTNTTDTPLVFMKEISSDGNVNTVDVIFPWHPIGIYTNPTILKLLLDPLFINQEAGYWPFQYSIHDIGGAFPNATGHSNGQDEMQPLEECGNMIIMTLAYAQRTGDNAYLNQHYDILLQWNDFLVAEALIPADQISTDDFAGSLANQTNLAVKGIIGIEAMAQIANRTGHFADGANFTNIAHNYSTQWQTLGFALDANPPHSTLSYGMNDTHGLLYNIYSDKELGLELIPQSVFDIQSAFYPTVANTYGVPLDTRHNYTKNDWELWCAAVASESTRDLFVNDIAKWIQETDTNLPVTDWYETINGSYPYQGMFIDRPVVGGWFAFLALNSAPTSGYVGGGNGTNSTMARRWKA